MKQKRLAIFNVFVNGCDIDWFCSLPREEQVNWILKNTNQKNEDLINEFLDSPMVTENIACQSCKEKKENEQHNQSSGVSETVANSPKSSKAPRNSSRRTN